MHIESFLRLARSRRAARRFSPGPIPDDVLDGLLEAAGWAPSGYNLQPWHFVVASDPQTRSRLFHACLRQRPVLEAPVVVVFTGDRNVVANRFERSLRLDLEAGAVTSAYATHVRESVTREFRHGPLGFGWVRGVIAATVLRRLRPVATRPVLDRRYWVVKQVMLGAMAFLLAAESAGLDTLPMEGFDEGRIRRVLGIPRAHIVPLVVPVGYPADEERTRTHIPLAESVHRERW